MDCDKGVRSGYDVSNLKPTLTVKGAEILKQLDSEDLKNLAKRCGLSSSGSKEQVVYRIAGRIPPSEVSQIDSDLSTQEKSLESRISELQKMKLNELKSLCVEYGIHYGSSSKNKLAIRLAKHELNGKDEEIMEREISTFLNDVGKINGDTKPFVTNLYATSFNYNDRFNKLLSLISYKPRKTSEEITLFIGLIEMAIVQTWCLYKSETIDDNDGESLKDFTKQLAHSIFQDYN